MKELFKAASTKRNPTNAIGKAKKVGMMISVGKKNPLGKLSNEDWGQLADSVSEVLSKVGIPQGKIRIHAHVDGLEGSSKFDFLDINAPDVSVTRSFFKDGDSLVAYHALLKVGEKMQGKGVAKGIIKALLPYYEKMGVDKIEVNANMDVGGYTWARFGFKAARQQAFSLPSQIKNKSLRQKAKAIVEDFYKTHSESDGFPVNLIASQPWGKKALLGSDWSGYIDLHDKKQVDEMKRYASS